MRVIVTRPLAQARQWVDDLRARGLDAVALPLIAVAAAVDRSAVHDAWASLAAQRLAVFVSPNAVGQFFAQRPAAAAWPARLLAASPGPGTTRALRDAGVPAGRIVAPADDSPQFDSEALWQRLRKHDWRGAGVLVVRGDGGREWLADTLTAHGATVRFVAAYRRVPPPVDASGQALLAQALARPAAHGWLFSSSEAVDHLLGLLHAGSGPQDDTPPPVDWSAMLALASHPRIAQRAAGAGFGRVISCRPSLDAVAGCIQSFTS